MLRLGAGLIVGAMGVAGLMSARADGPPSDPAMYYAGLLVEDGMPALPGTRRIEVTLWSNSTSTAPSFLECTTTSPDTVIREGRFRIPLDSACSDAVSTTPDLWVQVQVGVDPALPRTRMGAVPYALEAARASGAAGALRVEIDELVPPGTIVPYAGEVIPPGWELCDGRAVSSGSARFARLFLAIRRAWGDGSSDGDVATDFNLPELRGRFLRGLDSTMVGAPIDEERAARAASGAGGNSGNRVGTQQAESLAAHTHTGVTAGERDYPGAGIWYSANTGAGFAVGSGTHATSRSSGGPSHQHPFETDVAGDLETRPDNAAVLYIIRL